MYPRLKLYIFSNWVTLTLCVPFLSQPMSGLGRLGFMGSSVSLGPGFLGGGPGVQRVGPGNNH